MVKILGFHPGYPGLIPEQGTEMSLQGCSLLSLQDHYRLCGRFLFFISKRFLVSPSLGKLLCDFNVILISGV